MSLSFHICPKVFLPKRQSDSLHILISRCSPAPAHYVCIPSLLYNGGYYLRFLLRTWQRIKMIWKLAHQVKFEGDQGGWIPGLITRRLYNTIVPHAHFTFRSSILANQVTCFQCTGHQNARACENTSGPELKQSTTQLTFMPSLPSSPSLPSWGLQLLPSSPSLPWCRVFGEPGNVAEIAIITLSHATRRVLLSLREYLLQYLFKHTQYLYLNVGRSEGSPAPMGYLVPGRMWHGAWTTLLYNINTWNLCRRFAAHIGFIFHPFPAVPMLDPAAFPQKCSTQSVKVIRYVSLYLYAFPIIWRTPLSPCPLPFAYPHLYLRGPITYGYC